MADDKKKERKHKFKDFKSELKKVTWLKPRQLVKNTAAILALVLIVAVIVFVLDLTFRTLNEQGVEKLKTFVQRNEIGTEQTENTIDGNSSAENIITDAMDEAFNETLNSIDQTVTNENVTENNVTE